MSQRRRIQPIQNLAEKVLKSHAREGEITSFRVENLNVALIQGDITSEETDVIVNAANEQLRHTGGLALAMARKGGDSIQADSDAYIEEFGTVPTGNCAALPPGELKSQYVFHAVGPIYSNHSPTEAKDLLSSAVRSCLEKANELGVKSMAIPAISSGIYGYPTRCCAYHMLEEIVDSADSSELQDLRITILDDETVDQFIPVFDEFRENLVFE